MATKKQKVMTQPITALFRMLQNVRSLTHCSDAT